MTKNREEEQEGKKGKKGSKYATRPFDDTRRTYILSRSRSINQKSKVRDALPPPSLSRNPLVGSQFVAVAKQGEGNGPYRASFAASLRNLVRNYF